MRLVVVLCVLIAPAPVLAGPQPGPDPRVAPTPAPAAAPSKVQRLSFDDDLVLGSRDLGGGDVVRASRPTKHPSLVRARDSFIPELVKSAEDL